MSEAADIGISIDLTRQQMEELQSGWKVEVFVRAVPEEGLEHDLAVVISPPQSWNGS